MLDGSLSPKLIHTGKKSYKGSRMYRNIQRNIHTNKSFLSGIFKKTLLKHWQAASTWFEEGYTAMTI